MKKLLIFIFFIFSFAISLFLPRTTSASVLLHDDFNDGNANDGTPVDWEEYFGSQGSWFVQNGEYVGRVVKDRPEDLPNYSIAGENWTDYQFDVRIRGDEGVDKIVLFRYHSLSETYAIKLISSWWDWYGDKIALLKNNFINWTTSATFVNSQMIWYKLSVQAQGPNIKVYINDSPVPIIDYTDEVNPNLNGKIGLMTWPGFYNAYGSVTINRFDDVLVTSLEPPLQQLIFLPGMGASWNHEAMILGQEKQPEDWYMTPGVKSYDGLIQTIENAGYTRGENFFVFNYDWRKPVEEIASDLKEYLNRHPPPPSTEIDLVGHSLGGLVARAYVQENPENQIDQLVTVGSPHKGVVKTYYLWEGAELSKGLSGWQRIGAGIILALNKKGFQNEVDTVRAVVPGLKDLLPTFDYLRWQNHTPIPLTDMKERNTWLSNLDNLIPSSLLQILNTSVGIKEESTARWIDVQESNRLDKLLGRWVDGKPVDEHKETGDDTVLDFSATIEGTAHMTELLGLNHEDLIKTTEGQQAIVNLLGLSPISITSTPEIAYEPSLVFQLASPVNMTIYGPGGWQIGEGVVNNIPQATYSSDDQLIIIPAVVGGSYEIQIRPQGLGGSYRLLVGLITENGDYWEEFTGTVATGLTRTHQFWAPSSEQTETFLLLQQARTQIFDLKKYFNKEKIPPKLKGKIESQLANIMAQINTALNLLKKGDETKAQEKISQAIAGINALLNYINANSSKLFQDTKDLLLDPLQEIEYFLNQAFV